MCHPSAGERTQAALSAAVEFASVASQVTHDELRIASEQVAQEGLSLCEGHGRRCVDFLLAALRGASCSADAAAVQDAVWMLYKVTRSSEAARAWILEASGLDVLRAALVENPGQRELLREGAWLAYALDGLRGFAGLLRRCAGDSPGDAAVRGAVVCSVYDLVQGDVTEGTGCESRPRAAMMLALLVEALSPEGGLEPDACGACCSGLEALVRQDSRLCSLLLDRQGARLVVGAMSFAGRLGAEGEKCREAVAGLLAQLAEASPRAVAELRAAGAVGVLVQDGLVGNGRDSEAAMWALGHLGGMSAVLEVMAREPAKPAVLRGGVLAICDCAWRAPADSEELARTPAALRLLLQLHGRHEECLGPGRLREYVKTLGSVVACLAPHAPPGQVQDVDRGVEALLACLSSGADAAWAQPEDPARPLGGATAAEAAAEAVGRVALFAPEWRGALRRCGALEALARWIRCGQAPRRLQKYLFWAAAAIAGLPFVAAEMRLHMGVSGVVDAGLCTIIDILDDDIDGEYALVGVERGEDADLSSLLGLVVDSLRTHQGVQEVQFRGGHCIALLVPLAPEAALRGAAPAAAAAVVAAARRFPRRHDVVGGACAALRALCSLPRPPGGPAEPLGAALAEEGAAECVEQVLLNFGGGRGSSELLEDAAASLALLRGVGAVVARAGDWPPSSPLRAAALKALFEVCRADPRLLAEDACEHAAAACARLSAEEADDPGSRLHEVAALLCGLCSTVAGAAAAGA